MDFTLMNEQETIDVIKEVRQPKSTMNQSLNLTSKRPMNMIFEQEQSRIQSSQQSSVRNFTVGEGTESLQSSKYQIPKIDSLHSINSKTHKFTFAEDTTLRSVEGSQNPVASGAVDMIKVNQLYEAKNTPILQKEQNQP